VCDPAVWLLRLLDEACAERDVPAATATSTTLGTGGDLVARVLATLPTDERVTIVLVDAIGLGEEAAAEVLDVTPAAIGTRLTKVRALLSGPAGRSGSSGTSSTEGAVSHALQDLPVPDHARTFWPALGSGLLAAREAEAARAARAAHAVASAAEAGAVPPAVIDLRTGPTPPDVPRPAGGIVVLGGSGGLAPPATPAWPGPSAADDTPRPHPYAPLAPASRRRLRELAERQRGPAGKGRHRVAQLHIPLRRVVAMGAVCALALIAITKFRSTPDQAPQSLPAATLAGDVTDAWSAAQTMQGVAATTTYDAAGQPVVADASFAIGVDGSYRFHRDDGTFDLAYDAATDTRRQITSDGTQTTGVEETGLAPGPPDQTAAHGLPFVDELAVAISAWRTDPDVTVRASTVGGRPVWIADADVPAERFGGPGLPDHVTVTVDQETSHVLRLTRTAAGKPFDDVELRDVVVDQPLAPDALTLTFPESVQVTTFSYGFERLRSVDEITPAIGYTIGTPSDLPPGFELAAVAVAPAPGAVAGGTGVATGAGGSNPPSEDVVSLSYRHGLELLVITARRMGGGGPAAWSDPFGAVDANAGSGSGETSRSRTVTLATGKFAGLETEVVDDGRSVAHLWGIDESSGLVFTLSGDVSGDVLVDIAESLGV
jgi:hypothetical protein